MWKDRACVTFQGQGSNITNQANRATAKTPGSVCVDYFLVN